MGSARDIHHKQIKRCLSSFKNGHFSMEPLLIDIVRTIGDDLDHISKIYNGRRGISLWISSALYNQSNLTFRMLVKMNSNRKNFGGTTRYQESQG